MQALSSSRRRSQVYLDPKERSTTEYKLETFGAVYRFPLPSSPPLLPGDLCCGMQRAC